MLKNDGHVNLTDLWGNLLHDNEKPLATSLVWLYQK